MNEKNYAINPEWTAYYEMLESIRVSGVCNMWGASTVLADLANIDLELAGKILASWIENYNELAWSLDWRLHYYINGAKVSEADFRQMLDSAIAIESIQENLSADEALGYSHKYVDTVFNIMKLNLKLSKQSEGTSEFAGITFKMTSDI